MSEKGTDQRQDARLERVSSGLNMAIIAYAIIEFIAIVAVIYSKMAR